MTTYLNFSKMQALGNDFMVINTINQVFIPNKSIIQRWSHRHFGVGFDQLLIISTPKDSSHDYFYQIFNADGQEVSQCGNGARAVALFVHEHIKPFKNLRLKTKSTLMNLTMQDKNVIQLELPSPLFSPKQIPLSGFSEQKSYLLNNMELHAVNVGNPHAVLIVDSSEKLNALNLENIGSQIENHPQFPEKTNVNFMFIRSSKEIDLRVWERGCGETLACGSGALASAAIARKFYHLDPAIQIHLKGGSLQVIWENISDPMLQIGPAQEVYQGRIANPI